MKNLLKYFILVLVCFTFGIVSIELFKNNTFREKAASIVKNSKKEQISATLNDSSNELVENSKEEAFEISIDSKENETHNTNSLINNENTSANINTNEEIENENSNSEKDENTNSNDSEVNVVTSIASSTDNDASYQEIDVTTASVEENVNFSNNIESSSSNNIESSSSNNIESSSDNIIDVLELFSTSSNYFDDSIVVANNDSISHSNSVTNDETANSNTSDVSVSNSTSDNSTITSTDTSASESSSNSYMNPITGIGKGPVLDINIQYHVKDSKGRCGKGKGDYCAAVATVKYTTGTVKYYMGYQNNSQIIGGSCRSHAFMAATNAIKGTTYSTLDLQKYLYSLGYNGVLKAKGITKSIEHYGLTAKVYHSETSRKKAATLIKTALDNGQPVMIFVQHSLCSDLAGTHHALLLLGYDKNNKVVFIDSVPYSRNAKKRTVNEIAKCLSKNSISDSYYRMIIFSF